MTLERSVFALARIRRRTLLLDSAGLRSLFHSAGQGRARILDAVRGRGSDPRAKAEGLASQLAIGSWADVPDAGDLTDLLGTAPRYLSVGHSGLDRRCLGAVASLAGATSAVLLHDAIPSDWPHLQKRGSPARFDQKLEWVAKAADAVFAPLHATAADIAPHLAAKGWQKEIQVAPLGVRDPAPMGINPVPGDRPYFVVLGTIEPRKNLGFLLDLWHRLSEPRPRLVVIGARGWSDKDLFARLDRLVAAGDVLAFHDLGDAEVAAALNNARALLFPSLAEGFGYPPLEAAALGCPVISAPLHQTRELLGDSIIYADVNDEYQWLKAIEDLGVGDRRECRVNALPQWFVHFAIVLKSLE